jgi:predicted esterase
MSDSTVHTVRVPRTARVVTRGSPATASTWWVVLHGYGQRADDFARRCAPLAGPTRTVVAPEALSRFYVDGLESHEEVGASWMTRAAREAEIADYVGYLDRVVPRLCPDAAAPSIRVLGFSQGAATASRWALLGDTTVDRLVLWGGAPAHDLDLAAHAERLAAMDPTLVAGTDDPYVTPERRTAARQRLAEHDVPVTVHTFDGGHRLDDALLARLADSG